MRKLFQTQRLETVEGIAAMLNEHGIQTKITNGRSYKGKHRHDFSYSRPDPVQPAVWVVRAEDQPRARQLMREAGMLDAVRGTSSYLPDHARDDFAAPLRRTGSWALRIRLVLLAGIAVMIMVMMLGLVGG